MPTLPLPVGSQQEPWRPIMTGLEYLGQRLRKGWDQPDPGDTVGLEDPLIDESFFIPMTPLRRGVVSGITALGQRATSKKPLTPFDVVDDFMRRALQEEFRKYPVSPQFEHSNQVTQIIDDILTLIRHDPANPVAALRSSALFDLAPEYETATKLEMAALVKFAFKHGEEEMRHSLTPEAEVKLRYWAEKTWERESSKPSTPWQQSPVVQKKTLTPIDVVSQFARREEYQLPHDMGHIITLVQEAALLDPTDPVRVFVSKGPVLVGGELLDTGLLNATEIERAALVQFAFRHAEEEIHRMLTPEAEVKLRHWAEKTWKREASKLGAHESIRATSAVPDVTLYRVEKVPGSTPRTPIPDWLKDSPEYQAAQEASGRWFTNNPESLQWYRNFLEANGEKSQVREIRLSAKEAALYHVSNFPEALKFSRRPEEEFLLPRDIATRAKKVE